MRKIFESLIVLFVIFIFAGCASGPEKQVIQDSVTRDVAQVNPVEKLCRSIEPSSLNASVGNFLVKNKMIKPNQKWYVGEITSNLNNCFLILSELPGEVSDTIEILVYNPTTKEIKKFESVFSPPSTLRVGMGSLWVQLNQSKFEKGSNFFYYELKGASALDAYKSVVAKYPYSGLANGCIDAKINGTTYIPTGKLPWDPTVGRTWKLAHAEYSLKRGSPNEVDDVYSYQLDQDFQQFISGTLPCNKDRKRIRGSVQSWSSVIATVYNTKSMRWEAVAYDPRFSQPPTVPIHTLTHEILFDDQEVESCLQKIKKLNVTTELKPIESVPGFPPVGAGVAFKDPVEKGIEQVRKLTCVKAVNSLN